MTLAYACIHDIRWCVELMFLLLQTQHEAGLLGSEIVGCVATFQEYHLLYYVLQLCTACSTFQVLQH
jgi:hypothetical protein